AGSIGWRMAPVGSALADGSMVHRTPDPGQTLRPAVDGGRRWSVTLSTLHRSARQQTSTNGVLPVPRWAGRAPAHRPTRVGVPVAAGPALDDLAIPDRDPRPQSLVRIATHSTAPNPGTTAADPRGHTSDGDPAQHRAPAGGPGRRLDRSG